MSEDIKNVVREKYTEIVTRKDTSCCKPSCCEPSEAATAFSESYEHLTGYNPDADYGLGCGLPTEYADMREGEVVLDLGSGAGNDVFIARSIVGEKGRLIGVDMTEAMVLQARKNNERLGFDNVEFHLGDIEDLPLAEGSVDLAISNCVMNLVPDKSRAYAEVYRVLRSGGRFSISDIVTSGELSPAIRRVAALYAGCVAGALKKVEYLQIIRDAGFQQITVPKEKDISLPDELLLEYLSPGEIEDFRRSGVRIMSINVCGKKP